MLGVAGQLAISPLVLPQITMALPDELVRIKKDTEDALLELSQSGDEIEDENLELAESHVFLPKFTYQAIQSRRKRIRVRNTQSTN